MYVLNLRGNHVPYFPVFFSYLFIGLEKTVLFVNPEQLGDDVCIPRSMYSYAFT